MLSSTQKASLTKKLKSRVTRILITKAVDEVASHLNPTVCSALKAGTIDLGQEEVASWMNKSLKIIEDKDVLDKIFDASLLSVKSSWEAAKNVPRIRLNLRKVLI